MEERLRVSVASVTTAYNAARVLPDHLDSLLGQTRSLQEIIVVDNGSSDDTVALIARRYPEVTVLRLPENLGAAGAWSAGLEYAALRKRHDWVWAFDDDSVPQAKTLELLLAGIEQAGCEKSDIGVVAPLPIHTETGTCYPPLLWRDGFVKPSDELLNQPIWFADLVIASGCMVRREVVEKIGLPRSDFFMDFFDFEYCLRIRAAGYKIAVISGAKAAHEIGNACTVRLPGYLRIWPDHAPWREYYIARNMTYAAWWLYPSCNVKEFVIRHLTRHAGGVLLFGSNKSSCLKKMAQGFWDGRKASLGIRFRPN
jgi:GT2 family glycosyltransferase